MRTNHTLGRTNTTLGRTNIVLGRTNFKRTNFLVCTKKIGRLVVMMRMIHMNDLLEKVINYTEYFRFN